eukprot:PITA_34658
MVETRAQVMANDKIDKLEQSLKDLQDQLMTITNALSKGKAEAREEAYIGNEHNEGESSHSLHLWGTHQHSRLRPPKLDMHKFDGSHPTTWVAQMEPLTWDTFKKALIERFDHDSAFLGRLTKLPYTGTVDEYITAFEALAFCTMGLQDAFYMECFISGLKEAIQVHVRLHHPPTWLEACKVASNFECALAAQSNRPNFTAKGRPPQAHNTTQTLKVQKLSPAEMAERRKQGLCYYSDEKYSPGHKCKEPKFFQIDATDYNSSEEAPPLDQPEVDEEDNQKDNVPDEPVLSLHALAGISSPQTLKIRGFIKHRPVVVLIDSGSTQNFIHQRVVEAVHCFVRAVSKFQVQIADGGTMKCDDRCENVKLQMGDYQLKIHIFAIQMGGCDIVLGAKWIRTLGPITMDFQEIYMSFKKKNSTHTLRGLQAGAPSIISSHRMEKLLKNGHHGVIAQFNAIQAIEPISLPIHFEMQQILNNHLPVFDKPHELPPLRGEHDHNITLVLGT